MSEIVIWTSYDISILALTNINLEVDKSHGGVVYYQIRLSDLASLKPPVIEIFSSQLPLINLCLKLNTH
jgi:hypothetical protein